MPSEIEYQPHLCEVCNKRPVDHVCCVPGVPYSAGYCKTCLEAGANPYWILVANTASCGGVDWVSPEWMALVQITLDYLGKTIDDFRKDVEIFEKLSKRM